MSSSFLDHFVFGIVLSLIQVVAAIPWVGVTLPGSFGATLRRPSFWALAIGAVLGLGIVLAAVPILVRDPNSLKTMGQLYGAVLQGQLTADFFVLVFAVLLVIWPKGAAVALAAFREGVRQPMFWLIVTLAACALAVTPFIPYFTFGEDHLMVKELGPDIIMLAAVIFSILLASTSISEEIEGRTAVTLISKPISRRQFLLGKFVGILLASVVITGLLGCFFNGVMLYKYYYDVVEAEPLPQSLTLKLDSLGLLPEQLALVNGAARWAMSAAEVTLSLILGSCQVMVLLAIAVSLATRLPLVATVVTCVGVYVLGHLSPVLLRSVEYRFQLEGGGGGAVSSMLLFMARLFDMILPGLPLFKPIRVTDVPLPLKDFAIYVSEVAVYGGLFTAIVLLFGLILFEDRDLA